MIGEILDLVFILVSRVRLVGLVPTFVLVICRVRFLSDMWARMDTGALFLRRVLVGVGAPNRRLLKVLRKMTAPDDSDWTRPLNGRC